MKILIVIDMQNDFVSGTLGSSDAKAIVPNVVKKIEEFEGDIFVTYDTHYENYLETNEGKNLPVEHCIKDTAGWQICDELSPYVDTVVDKITFGSVELPNIIKGFGEPIEEIELCGLCTDICVVSNALLIKARFPEREVSVDSSCCAGVTPATHEAALTTMKMCQINVR